MSEIKIIKLSQNPEGFGDVADELEQDMFESALPKQHTHSYYEDEALGLYIGVWDTNSMIETAGPYACDEFMSLIEGNAEIKNNKTGMIETVMAGESFTIPQAYDCQWHQNGYLRKFYVIYEPNDVPKTPVTEGVVYYKDKATLDNEGNTPWQETSDGHRKKVLYQNHNKTFISGIWESEAFSTSPISFPYNEFIIIKQGSLIYTDDAGVENKVSEGEALFIPQGVSCAWQTQEKISIHFVQIKQ